MTAETFTEVTREQIRFVQDRLLAVARWADGSGVSEAAAELMLQPYRRLLDEMYERELPLAKLADASDLLLHVRGPAAAAPTPRISVVTRLLDGTRDQVTRVAKQLGGVTSVRVPAALDMGLVGLAEGSLYIGFSTGDDEAAELTRKAVDTIATASELVASDRPVEALASELPDPAVRDMAIAAIRHLSPSGHAGITAIDLLGRRVHHRVSLTTETRRHARRLMAQPPSAIAPRTLPSTAMFVGTVRELDLDASRFEIRNVEGFPGAVRCAHELDDLDAKRLVGLRVRVKGRPEYGPRDDVRLLWVDELEILD